MVDTWPADTGPRHTLTRLENLPAGKRPTWLNGATQKTLPGGVTYESAFRRGLVPKEIIDHAALILEGWDVCVYPRGHWTIIHITEKVKTHG